MFEAGAISKQLESAFVCPYLLGLEPASVPPPLGQFQSAIADLEGTRKLVSTLNEALGEAKLPDERLALIFNTWWPALKDRLAQVPEPAVSRPIKRESQRDDREVLAELLGLVRDQEYRLRRIEELSHQALRETQRRSLVLSPALEQLAAQESAEKARDAFKRMASAYERLISQGAEPERKNDLKIDNPEADTGF